jgi:tricorn protease
VLAIDGEPLTGTEDIYARLRNKSDRPVTLTLNRAPNTSGARTVSFRPRTSESDLMYLDMVLAKRKMVDELTGGRVGYIHIPDMGAPGIREFIKWYYPQLRKGGLIVDVRANGGGNVSEMLIERLRRELLATRFSRTVDETGTYPRGTFVGPMAAILNENSASDGDIFPAMFRQAKLGPLIGKRSWGGVVGITDHGPLIDGGTVNVPEFGFADTQGQWIIEGHGVDPDIEVEQDAAQVLAGHDPQLERAVKEVLARMKPGQPLPPRPTDPVKTKEALRGQK